MKSEAFLKTIKYEFHGPSGTGDLDAIKKVRWSRGFRMIDLFAGIGGIRLGFEAVGGKGVFSSEWDSEAQDTYEANFGERPFGDITKIAPEDIPDHDVLLGGFPCQPFSIIGTRKGFLDTRGTLFFSIEEILRVKQPAAILLENVKQFKTHDGGKTFATVIERLKDLGYFTHTAILNALNYGVCQKRERTFIVGFRANLKFSFPEPALHRPSLQSILEPDEKVDSKLWASDMIQKKRLQRLKSQGKEPFYPSIWHENKGGHIGIFPYSCALRANASYNYMLVNGNRRPTGREMLRIQGYPDSFKIVGNHAAIRKQAGNSVAVPVIEAIASQMIASLKSPKVVENNFEQLYLF
jgi:DNA (cytosine-5)-methyltransferase 1